MASTKAFFNGPTIAPKGSGMRLENSSSNVMTLNASQSSFSGGDFSLYFPNSYGTNNQYLKTDGAGNLSWATVSSGSVSASDITAGTGPVSISTSSGDITLSAPDGQTIQFKVDSSNILIIGDQSAKFESVLTCNASTQSSSTSTGSLVSLGGIGIAKNAYVGGNVNITSTAESSSTVTGSLIVSGGAGISKNVYIGGNLSVADNVTLLKAISIMSDTESTSTLTGALTVDGGVGIESNVNIGGNVNVTKEAVMSSNLTVSGTTQSTSVSTGALIVSGGVGIASNVNIGGNLVITGDLTVNGTTTTINSNITSIDDPVIELGTAGVADSFDRGIVGLYNARKVFFGWNNSANVFTFFPDATVTSGSNVVTGTAGKAVFGEIVAGSNVSINNNTESTSASTGSLVTTGGAGIAANVYVGGNVSVTKVALFNDTTESTSTSTGGVKVSGGMGVAKSVSIGANLTVSGQVVYSVDSVTAVSNVNTSALALWSGSALATIKHLQPPTNETHYYHANTSVSYVTGQHMEIFFTRPAGNTSATANIDFSASNLYSGTGTAQYLVFTQPGQSASLIYLGGDDSVKGWRIINTGAQVY